MLLLSARSVVDAHDCGSFATGRRAAGCEAPLLRAVEPDKCGSVVTEGRAVDCETPLLGFVHTPCRFRAVLRIFLKEPTTATASCASDAHGVECQPTHERTCVRSMPCDKAKSAFWASSHLVHPDCEKQGTLASTYILHWLAIVPSLTLRSPPMIQPSVPASVLSSVARVHIFAMMSCFLCDVECFVGMCALKTRICLLLST